MSNINRCNVCHGMLVFYGIDNRPGRWARWQTCGECGLFHADNTSEYLYIGKKRPDKSIFKVHHDSD